MIEKNKEVISMMKDELDEKIKKEFVGNYPKMFSYKKRNQQGKE